MGMRIGLGKKMAISHPRFDVVQIVMVFSNVNIACARISPQTFTSEILRAFLDCRISKT